MPRIARVCAAGYPHHITQRGNNKEKVFFDDESWQELGSGFGNSVLSRGLSFGMAPYGSSALGFIFQALSTM